MRFGSGKEYSERHQKQEAVLKEEPPIGFVAEAAETAAIGIYSPGHGYSDQDDESGQKTGNEKSARPAENSWSE